MSTPTYTIQTGYSNMDIDAIHRFLTTESYWAKDIPRETVDNALRHSLCIGVFLNGQQIGFSRLITDYTTFAYLADVYVEPGHRGKGLSKRMMKHIMEQEFVNRLRRIVLATDDAHGLYRQFGFQSPENPETLMEIRRKNLYTLTG